MLLPDYDELVALKSAKRRAGFTPRLPPPSHRSGGHASLFKGRGLDFAEFRDYAPGDDIRAIDWRVTARTGRTHTKLFTEEREQSVFLMIDLNSYMDFGTRRTFKCVQAARAAAHIAWQAHDLHDRVGALVFGQVAGRCQFLPARRSRSSIWQLFKVLCAHEVNPAEVPIEEALAMAAQRIPSGAAVFIISDFFSVSKEFERRLLLLSRGREVTLVKVTDPADRSLPRAEEITFRGDIGEQILIDTDDTKGAEEYRKQWTYNDDALREIAVKFGSHLIELATDRDVSFDLFAMKAPRSRRRPL